MSLRIFRNLHQEFTCIPSCQFIASKWCRIRLSTKMFSYSLTMLLRFLNRILKGQDMSKVPSLCNNTSTSDSFSCSNFEMSSPKQQKWTQPACSGQPRETVYLGVGEEAQKTSTRVVRPFGKASVQGDSSFKDATMTMGEVHPGARVSRFQDKMTRVEHIRTLRIL